MIIQSPELIKKPTVSVVICAYNREDTIKQAIDSVLNQKCNFLIEIVIGEDCGTDETRNICIEYQKKYPQTIKLVLQDENCGLGKNWASIVQESRGKYLASCDDDDYWHNPNKLQMQVDFMEKNPDYGLVHTEYDVLQVGYDSVIHNYNKSRGIKVPQGFIMKEIFTGSTSIRVSTSLIRKELLDRYFPFDDYTKLKVNLQDWPTWIILSKYSKVGYLPLSTTTFRKGHESLSNPEKYEKIEKKYAAEHVMYKYICNMFPNDLIYSESAYLNYVNAILLNLAYEKKDLASAKIYGKRLIDNGYNTTKVRMSQNIYTFTSFYFLKKIRKLFNN